MFQLDPIGYFFWLSTPVLQIFLVRVMQSRKVHLRLPVFYGFLIFEICCTIALFLLHLSSFPWAYFVVYWATKVVDIVLSLAVVHELYAEVFCDYPAMRQAINTLFRWATVVLIFVAAVTVASTSGAESDRLMAALMSMDQAAGIVRGGLLALLFLLGRFLGLRWKHYAFGIMIGLALYTSIEMTAMAVETQVGLIGDRIYNFVNGAAYFCAVLVWVNYLVSRERDVDSPQYVPAHELEEWNETLSELIQR